MICETYSKDAKDMDEYRFNLYVVGANKPETWVTFWELATHQQSAIFPVFVCE